MSVNSLASICIPSFNHAPYLPAALDSALSQTYSNIEIIVVDDGSTDGSLEIARSYALRHPSLIKVFTHPGRRNLGISATVNLAFRKASGEYYSGLASDDVSYPTKIERQIRFLNKHPSVGWVYGQANLIDKTGRKLRGQERLGIDITRAPEPLEQLIKRNVIPGATVLARRLCVENIGLHDETLIYSDWDFWIRFLAYFKAGFIDKPVAMFRIHDDNTSFGVDLKVSVARGFEVMRKLRQQAFLIGGGLSKPRIQALLDLQMAYHHFLLHDELQATNSLQAAFGTDPSLKEDTGYLSSWLMSPKLYDSLDRVGEYNFKIWTLQQLPSAAGSAYARQVERRCRKRLSTEALFYTLQQDRTRRKVINGLVMDPGLLSSRALRLLLLESLVGRSITSRLRHMKGQVLDWQQ